MAIGLLSMATLVAASYASPYVPSDGQQVIERLPSKTEPQQQEFQRLRSSLAASPGNLEIASRLARRYIEAGRAAGDPRYFGYAQSTLAPWWNQADPPDEVRILRATLLQSQHQFAQALADLDAVLQSNPRHAQAWLTQATIQQVQGDYAQAKSSCEKLRGAASELVVATCVAGAASLNGQAAQSYAMLKEALNKNSGESAGIKVWALTLLAEIAERSGNHSASEAHYRQALALDPADGYLLGAYADFLLDRNREAEVIALLKNRLRPDGLLLRYALALKRQKPAAATESVSALQSRFAAAKMRGDGAHEREQARFELHLIGNAQGALQLAQENWRTQKEPADARILLEAAIASKDKVAAEPVLRWLKEKMLEDRTLEALAAKAGGMA